MNADGMVSGERCNCEGQLAAEADLARLRSEIEQVAQKWRTYTEAYSQWNLAADELDEVLAALARGGE